jgi:hypothetical protein
MNKVSAVNLKAGQVIKVSDMFGTHTMVVTKVSSAFRKEVQIKGVILTTTNKDERFNEYQVGSDNFFFKRYKTRVQVL